MVQFLQNQIVKNSKFVSVSLLVSALLLPSACGPRGVRPAPGHAPVDDLAGTNPGIEQPRRKPPSERMVRGQRSAVRTLTRKADQQSKLKKYSSAAVLLERALTISPYDARIWNNLAQVRFNQGKYDLAESLAQKSNSFARSNNRLKAANWRLISKARSLQGNAVGATEASNKAKEFSR